MLGLKLHSIIGRTSSSFWAHPVDVLSCILDVTCFTVNAVCSIDDKPHLSLIVGLVFIHSGRTEPTLRSSVLCLVHSLWHIVIHQGQVRRLVGLVVCPGQRDGGEKVKCELAVRLWVLKLLAGRRRLRCIRVNAFVLQGPWLFSCCVGLGVGQHICRFGTCLYQGHKTGQCRPYLPRDQACG